MTSTGPTSRLERRAELVGIADHDDGRRLGADVRPRDPQTSSAVTASTRAPVAVELVVGQAVDEQPGQRARDRPGVSNRSGKTPIRKSRAAVSSASVTGSSRIRSSSVRNSAIAGTVTSVFTAARAVNGPRPRRRSKPALAP